MLYICNAFSLNMLGGLQEAILKIKKIDTEEVKKMIIENKNELISAIGHLTTSQILSTMLNREIPMNRIAVSLREGDKAIIFQIRVRLEEGQVLSPEQIKELPYEFYVIELQ